MSGGAIGGLLPRVTKPRHDDLTAPHYGYIYNEAAEVVPVGADVSFDSNATMVGISFTPGTSQVTIDDVGTYRVQFVISGIEANQFALLLRLKAEARSRHLATPAYGPGLGSLSPGTG